MSEYQYYEFLAVDRPLTTAQVAAVRQFSTRADITPTRFVNTYHYGSFKGNADDFLKRYFDVHLYVTNWGTRRFAFRLPRDLVDRTAVESYAHDLSLNVEPAGDWLLVDIDPQDESGDWDDIDGHGWMASLAPARAEVLAGDLRPLYLGWLAGVQMRGPLGGEADDDDASDDDASDDDGDNPVPPTPPGLRKLTAAQRAMVEFYGIDAELLDVAAADSPAVAPPPDLRAAIGSASAAQKDGWLADLLGGDDPLAAARIRRQLLGAKRVPPPTSPTRTIGQLRQAWGELDARRRRDRATAAAAAKTKRDAADAAAREVRLTALARRVDAAWREVDAAINEKNRDGYAKAVATMVDLQAVAARPGGDPAAFDRHLSQRLADHRRRSTFMELVRKAGLVGE